MKFFGVGNALYYYRNVHELMQTELCEGICSVTTLSRIEKGGREVDSLMSELLLNRLGKSSNRYEFILNEEDYLLFETRFLIEDSIKNKNIEKAELFLEKYARIMPVDEIVHQQFLLLHRMYVAMLKDEPEEKIKEGLYQAINMTRPDYKDKEKKNILFSAIEIRILYELFMRGEFTVDDLSRAFEFMEKYYDVEEQEEVFLPFLRQLIVLYEKEENYPNVIRIANRAIDIIRSGRSFRYLADFYYQKIKAQEKLYHAQSEWQEIRRQLIEECNHVYYVYMIEDNLEKLGEVEQFCKERLQCQITK